MSPYWQVADVYFIVIDGEVQMRCSECHKPIGRPKAKVTMAEASKAAASHQHKFAEGGE